MSEDDINSNRKRKRESDSDTQGGDEPLDMEDQEGEETSMKVNEHGKKPDLSDEEVDEKMD